MRVGGDSIWPFLYHELTLGCPETLLNSTPTNWSFFNQVFFKLSFATIIRKFWEDYYRIFDVASEKTMPSVFPVSLSVANPGLCTCSRNRDQDPIIGTKIVQDQDRFWHHYHSWVSVLRKWLWCDASHAMDFSDSWQAAVHDMLSNTMCVSSVFCF